MAQESNGIVYLLWAVFAFYLVVEIVVLFRRFKASVERQQRRTGSQAIEGDHDRSGPRR